jgi:hypothetical protein
VNAVIPPDRRHLAAMLRVHAHSAALFGIASRRDLIEYIGIAEDTIEQQAAMLHADAAELANRHRVRRELVDSIDGLAAENASLRLLVAEAIDAGANNDGEAITLIRAALKGTS